ncbi:MAG TPA: hypothetical protein DDZ51_17450 [Planctomycetaceae bacterium]|nr:hypothetical protein [Planctomycetaceae bacterium]
MSTATITMPNDTANDLPPGCESILLGFAKGDCQGQMVWLDLADSGQNKIVLLSQTPVTKMPALSPAENQLQVITVTQAPSGNQDLVQRLQLQFESQSNQASHAAGSLVKSALLTLQGAQILWRPSQMIVFAPLQRMQSICHAIVEASFYEFELRSIEKSLDAAWENVQADSPLAFEFNERAIPRREELSTRFQSVLSLRTRFARLAPQVLVPHIYPPTLASQIAERLRERTRMPERLELVEGKLEAQERIYEMCSNRVSEFMVARTGHHLEWAIIILLLAQTVLIVIEYLSSASA